MRFWLGIGIAERSEDGEGISLRFEQDSFPSFNDAVERLAVIQPPAVAGRVIRANAYVVRAETLEEAADLLRAVFERHGTSPHVKLVAAGVRTRPLVAEPAEAQLPAESPGGEALAHVHGELCITHQLTTLALSHAQDGAYRDRLLRHREAIEDLGFAVRVSRAELAGQAPPTLPPRGRERLGYGFYQLGSAESATLTSALSSLAAELSIARHQARVAQRALPPGNHRLDGLIAELSAFAATVEEYS